MSDNVEIGLTATMMQLRTMRHGGNNRDEANDGGEECEDRRE